MEKDSDRVIVFLRFGWWSLCFGKTALSGLTWFFLLLWWLKHQRCLKCSEVVDVLAHSTPPTPTPTSSEPLVAMLEIPIGC
jgi:hypothetical protein